MANMVIGGALLKDMFLAGAALLEKNKAHIDSLNVFPVPDGDTGTNMAMTMQSAAKELRSLNVDDVSSVAQTVALGALKGARGNSGVILSQILRGFSRALSGKQELDAAGFAEALTTGTAAAYKAVMKPREGTMLTVARSMAEALTESVETGANVYKLIDIMLEKGEIALKKTPEQLPVLKEAGVVDSGGMGLLVIFKGFKMAIDGEEIDDIVIQYEQATSLPTDGANFEDLGEIEFGYCTEFFITHLDSAFSEDDLDKLREKLNKVGDSVVVAHDADFVKIHVHTNAPGKILQLAIRLGEVDKIKIENMREQNREILANLKKTEKENAFVAVASGSGIESLFVDMGAAATVQGGQTLNPSIDTISRAIKKANARNVFVLPNNSNIIMAAQQAAELSERNVYVIPTKSMAAGVAAAVCFDAEASAKDIERYMNEGAANIVAGSVTYAVRDTSVNGNAISEGDIIGLMNGSIEEVGTSVDEISLALLTRMISHKSPDATVTIFYGDSMDEANANALADALNEKFPDADCTVFAGGQPLYYYIFSVE